MGWADLVDDWVACRVRGHSPARNKVSVDISRRFVRCTEWSSSMVGDDDD